MTRHFNYWLTGIGWAEATFASDHQSITFAVSYLSDPLSDLFEALQRLISKKTNFEKIAFADEPGEHLLLLTRVLDETLNIEICWSDEWTELDFQPSVDTGKKLVYADRDTVDNLSRSIYLGIESLLKRTSSEEYKKQWNIYEFPFDSYNKLKKLLNYPTD